MGAVTVKKEFPVRHNCFFLANCWLTEKERGGSKTRTYTATNTSSTPIERQHTPIRDPEHHATVQGLRRKLEDLSLQLDKGLRAMTQLEAANDPRWAEARKKWRLLEKQYRAGYEEYDALLEGSGYGCPQCDPSLIHDRIPPYARCCATHARPILSARARLRGES